MMKTVRQQLAEWAMDEDYPFTDQLTETILRIASYEQYRPAVHQQQYPVTVAGPLEHITGVLWDGGGPITCQFNASDDVFSDPDYVEIPTSVLDAENWEVECQRLLDIRHRMELENQVQYYRNCIAAYKTALDTQTTHLAEAEANLLAFLTKQ